MKGQDSHNEGAVWEHESFQQWGNLKSKIQAQPLGLNVNYPYQFFNFNALLLEILNYNT